MCAFKDFGGLSAACTSEFLILFMSNGIMCFGLFHFCLTIGFSQIKWQNVMLQIGPGQKTVFSLPGKILYWGGGNFHPNGIRRSKILNISQERKDRGKKKNLFWVSQNGSCLLTPWEAWAPQQSARRVAEESTARQKEARQVSIRNFQSGLLWTDSQHLPSGNLKVLYRH